MSDGFIIEATSWMVENLKKLSIVEYIKRMFISLFKAQSRADKKKYANYAIDTFILSKWTLLIFLILTKTANTFTLIITSYLVFYNIYTYFYYHVWDKNAIIGTPRSVKNVRRRFITLTLSFGYVIATFAYYYSVTHSSCFSVSSSNFSIRITGLYHSFASAFVGGSSYMTPINNTGLVIQSLQVLITFIYLGVIFNRADNVVEEDHQPR